VGLGWKSFQRELFSMCCARAFATQLAALRSSAVDASHPLRLRTQVAEICRPVRPPKIRKDHLKQLIRPALFSRFIRRHHRSRDSRPA
ncbi:hypothetical protein BDW68DRAFT_155451, partial [Aspergillus falconensis]